MEKTGKNKTPLPENDPMDEQRINLLIHVPGFGAIGKDIIESGRMSVIKDWDGDKYILKQLSQGDCIGEMALFDFPPVVPR